MPFSNLNEALSQNHDCPNYNASVSEDMAFPKYLDFTHPAQKSPQNETYQSNPPLRNNTVWVVQLSKPPFGDHVDMERDEGYVPRNEASLRDHNKYVSHYFKPVSICHLGYAWVGERNDLTCLDELLWSNDWQDSCKHNEDGGQ